MAAGDFGLTTTSGLSIGWDTARGDYSPVDRKTGPFLSVGTQGNGLTQILLSTQSVNAGGVTASRTTQVHLKVDNAPSDSLVIATPWSGWSSAALNTLIIQSYMSTSDGSVMVALSNNSGNNVTVPTLNWQIMVIS